LLHEVQTRREDWQAGALPAAYMRIKLERAGKGVSALERAGLPPGWTRAWDAASARYYFAEPATGVASWEDPRRDPTADESGLPPPPPPPPLPSPSLASEAEMDWLARSSAKSAMHPERVALLASRASELAAEAASAAGALLAHDLVEDETCAGAKRGLATSSGFSSSGDQKKLVRPPARPLRALPCAPAALPLIMSTLANDARHHATNAMISDVHAPRFSTQRAQLQLANGPAATPSHRPCCHANPPTLLPRQPTDPAATPSHRPYARAAWGPRAPSQWPCRLGPPVPPGAVHRLNGQHTWRSRVCRLRACLPLRGVELPWLLTPLAQRG
jgi:hypothetical protein